MSSIFGFGLRGFPFTYGGLVAADAGAFSYLLFPGDNGLIWGTGEDWEVGGSRWIADVDYVALSPWRMLILLFFRAFRKILMV